MKEEWWVMDLSGESEDNNTSLGKEEQDSAGGGRVLPFDETCKTCGGILSSPFSKSNR